MAASNNEWEIIDNGGTIHSGTEEEMRKAWYVMTASIPEIRSKYGVTAKEAAALIGEWVADYEGDLKLIEIHDIRR